MKVRNARQTLRQGKRRRNENGFQSQFANIMRGGGSLADLIVKLTRHFHDNRQTRLQPANPFLARGTLRIELTNHGTSLPIRSAHLEQLNILSSVEAGAIADNLLMLVCDFIKYNEHHIENWINFDLVASGLTLQNKGEETKARLLELPRVHQQSMYAMRLYAALHAFSDKAISEYLSTNLTSNWFRNRFLYPMIFSAINAPPYAVMDQLLKHMIADNALGRAERELIHFLISPENAPEKTLAYLCYVSLLSHPYDALQYITLYFERILAWNQPVSQFQRDALAALSGKFHRHRFYNVNKIIQGVLINVSASANHIPFPDTLPLQFRKDIIAIIDIKKTSYNPRANSIPLDALHSLRWKIYPSKDDFETLDLYRRRFSMLSIGSFIEVVSRALFLYEREPYRVEVAWLLRGAMMADGFYPLLIAGPSGSAAIDALSRQINPLPSSGEALTEAALSVTANQRPDRMWINAANWAIGKLQRAGKIQEWAAVARSTFPVWVEPRYLSGLDWVWLAGVLKVIGIKPLRGEPNGIYTLFLNQVESGLREYTALRLSLEPIAAGKTAEQFASWLCVEFRRDALSIAKVVLTADMLLKLRMSNSYTDALTTRLLILAHCVKEFKFQKGVFTEEDFASEANALTATLSRMSVGAQQFEISWITLRSDAAYRVRGTYEAYETLVSTMDETSSITNPSRQSTYPYANGAIVEYDGAYREWPLILTIGGILDTFFSHPSAGIEAILSVRIRHDNFRREITDAVDEAFYRPILGLLKSRQKDVSRSIFVSLSRAIQSWLDRRMHTFRKQKEKAVFSFTPSKEEMRELVKSAASLMTFDDVVELVFEWLKPKIAAQLVHSRELISSELIPELKATIAACAAEHPALHEFEGLRESVVSLASTAAERRAEELKEWFKVPNAPRSMSMTFGEIFNVVQSRFVGAGGVRKIAFSRVPDGLKNVSIEPDHIRFAYDMISEIAQNAVKHGHARNCRIRFKEVSKGGDRWIIASNLVIPGKAAFRKIEGHPYKSVYDTLFAEGNTGCAKISHIAATMLKREAESLAVRKSRSFHLLIPFK